MSESLTLHLADADATVAAGGKLAAAIAAALPEGQGLVVYLEGDLGAGKTTFSRGLLRGCGHSGNVPSPTYTLVEPYELSPRAVYHLDLYRLQDGAELEFLGLEDLPVDALMLVEWPGRGAGSLAAPDLNLSLAIDGAGRRLELSAATAAADVVLQQMA